MNTSRRHTDQADSNETLDSLEEKLAAVPRRSSIQLTSAESRARALVAANTPRCPCSDCPCDGTGAVAAAVLIALGVVIGSFITVLCLKGLP